MSSVQIDLELVTKSFVDALKSVEKLNEKFTTNIDDSFKDITKSLEELNKSITETNKQVGKSLSGLDEKLKKTGDGARGVGNDGKEGFGKFSTAFNVMAGNIAANAVTFAFNEIKGSLHRVLEEAIQSEEAINSLNTALRISGKYSVQTSKDMQDFAMALSNVTTIDDDLIIKNQALLLSITKLSTNGINQAVKAAADLSASLGIDLDTATAMVAKSINGSTESFAKLGINIKKSQVASEQFANTMQALSAFSGAAESKTKTFSGALEQNNVAFGNMLSALGQIITTSPVVIGLIGGLTTSIQETTVFLEENKQAAQDWVASFLSAISPIIGAFKLLGTPFQLYHDANKALYDVSVKLEEQLGIQADTMGELTNITSQATAKNNEFINSLLVGATSHNTFYASILAANEAKKAATQVTNELTAAQLAQQQADLSYVNQLATANSNIAEDYKLKLEMLKSYYDQKELQDSNAEIQNFTLKRQRESQYTNERRALLDQQLADEKKKVANSIATEENKRKAIKELQKKYDAEYQAGAAEHSKRVVELDKSEKDQKKRLADKDVANRDKTLTLFATMAESSSQELQAIGKAAAIAQIAYQAPSAIASAFAYGTSIGGPVLGGVFAATAAVAMGAQAAAIGAAKPPAPHVSTPSAGAAPTVLTADETKLKETELEILKTEQALSKKTDTKSVAKLEELKRQKTTLEKQVQASGPSKDEINLEKTKLEILKQESELSKITGTAPEDAAKIESTKKTIADLNAQRVEIERVIKLAAPSAEQTQLKTTESAILELEAKLAKSVDEKLTIKLEKLNSLKDSLEQSIKIASLEKEIKAAPKFATGGIVSGSNFTGDKVTAKLNSGEMVLNRSQQANLFNQINSNSGSSNKMELLLGELINTVKATSSQSINIDGREIINVVRNGLQSGRSLA